MASDTVMFRCARCGAPLDVSPETIVAVCNSCGYVNWFIDTGRTSIEMLPVERASLQGIFEKIASSDKDLSKLGSIKLREASIYYVPSYFADVHTETKYSGRAEVTLRKEECEYYEEYNEETGETEEKEECETVRDRVEVSVAGYFSSDYPIDIVARRNIYSPAVSELMERYRASKSQLISRTIPLEKVDWKRVKGVVLSGEISPAEAETIARDLGCERLFEEVGSKMRREAEEKALGTKGSEWSVESVTWLEKRIPCKATNKSISPLILIPYIRMVYEYEGSSYNIYASGWDGAPLLIEKPVTKMERAKNYLVATGIAGVLGGLGGGLVAMAGDPTWAGLFLLLGGIGGNYYYVRKMLAEKKTEKPIVFTTSREEKSSKRHGLSLIARRR